MLKINVEYTKCSGLVTAPSPLTISGVGKPDVVSRIIHVEDAHALLFSMTDVCHVIMHFRNGNFTFLANGIEMEVKGSLYTHELGAITFPFTFLTVLPQGEKNGLNQPAGPRGMKNMQRNAGLHL